MNSLNGGYLPSNFEFSCTHITETMKLLNKINLNERDIKEFIINLKEDSKSSTLESLFDKSIKLLDSKEKFNYNDDSIIFIIFDKIDKSYLKLKDHIKTKFNDYKKNRLHELYIANKEELKIIAKDINPFNLDDNYYRIFYSAGNYFYLFKENIDLDHPINNYIIDNQYKITKYRYKIHETFIIRSNIKSFIIPYNPRDKFSPLSENSLTNILFCSKNLIDNLKSIYNIYLYTKFNIGNNIKYEKVYILINELFIKVGEELVSKKDLSNILNFYVYSGHIHLILNMINNRNKTVKNDFSAINRYSIFKKREYYNEEEQEEITRECIKEVSRIEYELGLKSGDKKVKGRSQKQESKSSGNTAEPKPKSLLKIEIRDTEYCKNSDCFAEKNKKNNINKLLINKYKELFTKNDSLTIDEFITSIKINIITDSAPDKDIILTAHYRLLYIINLVSEHLNNYILKNHGKSASGTGFDLAYSYNYYDLIFSFQEFQNKIERENKDYSINTINNIIIRSLDTVYNIIILETSYLLNIIYEIDMCYHTELSLINQIITVSITSILKKNNPLIPINMNYALYDKLESEHINDYYNDNINNLDFFNYIKVKKHLFNYGNYLVNPDTKLYNTVSSTRPDCAENFIFNLINYLIFDEEKKGFNVEWLPTNTIKPIKEFYERHNSFTELLNSKPFVEFDSLLQNLEFTYQSFDTYMGRTIKTVYKHINIDRNPTFDDLREAYEYKIYDDKGEPIRDIDIKKYNGWEIEPGYANIIRIFNHIFGYNITDDYNENKIMNKINKDSFKDILSTFKNPDIIDILKDYSITNLSDASRPVNKDSIFSEDAISIKFKDIDITLYYGHAIITITSFSIENQINSIDLIRKYNIENILTLNTDKSIEYNIFLDNIPYDKLTNIIHNNGEFIRYNDYEDLEYLINNIKYICKDDKLKIKFIENELILKFIKKITDYCILSVKEIIVYELDNKSKDRISNVLKYFLDYLDINCLINKSINIGGERIINRIMHSKSLPIIKFFIKNYDVDLLHKSNEGNIFHVIKYYNYDNKNYFEGIIKIIKESKPEIFNKMIIQENKKKNYPFINIIINNIDKEYHNFNDLIPDNDLIICKMLTQYIRFISNKKLNNDIVISLLSKIKNTSIRTKICIYSINLIIKFIDNQHNFTKLYNLIGNLFEKCIIDLDYFRFINEYYFIKNDSSPLINNVESLIKLLPIILTMDSINIWELYNPKGNEFKIFIDRVICEDNENNKKKLISFLVSVGQARNPRLIGILRKIIQEYLDFFIESKDMYDNTLFHHIAIGNIKISNPIKFIIPKPDSPASDSPAAFKSLGNINNVDYKYQDFFKILFVKNKELFKLKNKFGWRIIDIISVIPIYSSEMFQIKDATVERYYNKDYSKVLFDKIKQNVKILIDYYGQESITEINEEDLILILYYHKFNNIPMTYIENLSKIINEKIVDPDIKNKLSKLISKNNIYKYIPYYLLKYQYIEHELLTRATNEILTCEGFNNYIASFAIKENNSLKYSENYIDDVSKKKIYPKDYNSWFYKDDDLFIDLNIKDSDTKLKYLKYKRKYLNLRNKI